jgi:aryl-alcohol dehydrogenase-like predicted oxidoreductase
MGVARWARPEGRRWLVKASFDAGVTFFDTADVYAGGMSETIFGQSLRNLALPRDEVVVATKVFGRLTPPAPQDPGPAQKSEIERRAKARNRQRTFAQAHHECGGRQPEAPSAWTISISIRSMAPIR